MGQVFGTGTRLAEGAIDDPEHSLADELACVTEEQRRRVDMAHGPRSFEALPVPLPAVRGVMNEFCLLKLRQGWLSLDRPGVSWTLLRLGDDPTPDR